MCLHVGACILLTLIYKYIYSNYNYYYYTLCEATVELYALLSVSEALCTHGVTDSQNQNVNFVEETQKQHIMTNMHTFHNMPIIVINLQLET